LVRAATKVGFASWKKNNLKGFWVWALFGLLWTDPLGQELGINLIASSLF